MNTIVIGTINQCYWSYVHQLSYRKRGPHDLYVHGMIHVFFFIWDDSWSGTSQKEWPETHGIIMTQPLWIFGELPGLVNIQTTVENVDL